MNAMTNGNFRLGCSIRNNSLRYIRYTANPAANEKTIKALKSPWLCSALLIGIARVIIVAMTSPIAAISSPGLIRL